MHTLNRQLEDREESFSEFDKKYIGLESQTVPLIAIIFSLSPLASPAEEPYALHKDQEAGKRHRPMGAALPSLQLAPGSPVTQAAGNQWDQVQHQ